MLLPICLFFLIVPHVWYNCVRHQTRLPKWSEELIQIKKVSFFECFSELPVSHPGSPCNCTMGEHTDREIQHGNTLCHKNKPSTKWSLSPFIIQASKLVHYIGCAVLKLLKKPYLHSKYANWELKLNLFFTWYKSI